MDVTRIAGDHCVASIVRAQRHADIHHVRYPSNCAPRSYPQGQPLIERDDSSDRSPQQPRYTRLASSAASRLSDNPDRDNQLGMASQRLLDQDRHPPAS